MKKIYKILIVIIAIFILINVFSEEKSEELRFRVIANSDSTYDQSIKLIVKNMILKEDINNLPLNIIKDKCAYILKEYNVSYGVSVSIEKQKFDTKYFGDKIIKGGTYDTLVIRLGEALGKNYWTVLDPEYFGVGFEDIQTGDVKYELWIEKIFR